MKATFYFYILGCFASLGTALSHIILTKALYFITNISAYDKNLEKIGIYSSPILGRLLTYKPTQFSSFLSLAFILAISWLGAICNLWGTLAVVIDILKSRSLSTEQIKAVRLPIILNSKIPPEEVWARQVVLHMLITGSKTHIFELRDDIEALIIRTENKNFNKDEAWDYLEGLLEENKLQSRLIDEDVPVLSSQSREGVAS